MSLDMHPAGEDERQVGQTIRFSSCGKSHQGVIEFIHSEGQVMIVKGDDQYLVLMRLKDGWTFRGDLVTLEG